MQGKKKSLSSVFSCPICFLFCETRQALGNSFPSFVANVNYLHNHLERQHPHALPLGQLVDLTIPVVLFRYI